MRFLTHLCAFLLAVAPVTGYSATGDDLPDIGSPSSVVFSSSREQQIGRMVVRQLREQGMILDDPEVNEYVSGIGYRLASNAHEGQHRFRFFVVNDSAINAFALPGGFIGINAGLVLASSSESEFAGVLAHEIAHVSQRHISRFVDAAGQTNLISAAAMVAALLLGGLAGASSDAMTAAVVVAQGTAAQQQINFTRNHEHEADRVGIQYLADAGFDPYGMPNFFATLAQRNSLAVRNVPEFLMTHPVTRDRIAESQDRAAKLKRVTVASSLDYQLARERLRVLSYASAIDAVSHYSAVEANAGRRQQDHVRYGMAFALLRAGRAGEAAEIAGNLYLKNENVIAYHSLYAQTMLAAGVVAESLQQFEKSNGLFPRNVPLTTRYGQALLETGNAGRAHELLLDLVNNIDYTPEQLRLLALAASAAGDTADAHYYMSEHHVLNGELFLAVDQLKMALATPGLEDVQQARFAARKEFVEKHLPKRRPPRESVGANRANTAWR